VFADFAFAHFMRFKNEKASGRVNLCPAMIHPHGCTKHDHCKVNVLHHLIDRFELSAGQVLAVGDGDNDICLLQAAGQSVAFRGKTKAVRLAGKFRANSMSEVLFYARAVGHRRECQEQTVQISN
jgi:phosphoserine phosphatase